MLVFSLLIPLRPIHAGGCGQNGAGFICAPPAGEREPGPRQMRFRPDWQMTGWRQGWEGFSAGAMEGLRAVAGLPGVSQIFQGLGWVTHQIGRGYGAYVGGMGLGTLSPGEQLAADIGQGLLVEGAMTLGTAGLGKGASAIGARARAFITRGRPLPTAPDPLMPHKMALVADEAPFMANIPKRVVSNVDELAGRKLGSGEVGNVFELAGDPTRVIKTYHGAPQYTLKSARNQISGLQLWKENIAKARLQDKMEVVDTLEYGIDAQGRAFTVHPRMTGELSSHRMSQAHLEELYELKRALLQVDPQVQELIRLGISARQLDAMVRFSTLGNFFRTPSGKWIVIDPY